MAQLKEIFDLYDLEADGYIKSSDLGNVLRALGHNPSELQLQELLSQVDSGMGKLSFSEVNTAASSFQADGDYAQQIKDAFKVFDKDGKGSLAASELTHIMCNLGEKMTQQEVEEMLKEAGLNGSSAVSQDDFIRIMLAAP
eukprot:TRINITY_DN9709_c0_g1_i3.p1 TRINITY_DN9709_c0_g1~~TRINITY_DN9709_c0_g1_i3.p1  ORF type:complete len:141 (+),score=50.36 TRINITY_DN9709_c0_g1_i3:145-567(+)